MNAPQAAVRRRPERRTHEDTCSALYSPGVLPPQYAPRFAHPLRSPYFMIAKGFQSAETQKSS